MLLLLLLPFLLHLLGAKDVPKDTRYVVKKISACPDVGYFFKWDNGLNSLEPGLCYLCFCQNDGTAMCWRRENRRCDVSSYQHHGIGKRDARVRRSPGITDIFFRDASRDVFNKNAPETCKPYESSFSEGCPPADWCVGCTVCDCDANGRWDCHILSFCPDKEDKSRTIVKKKKPPAKKNSNTPKNNLRSQPKPTKKPQYVANNSKPTNKPKPKPSQPLKKFKNVPKNSNIQKNTNKSPKPLVIKKNLSTKKPILKKTTPDGLQMTTKDANQITQEVVKQVMIVMKKLFNQSQAINSQLAENLERQKRAMAKRINQKKQKTKFKNKSQLPPAIKKPYVKRVQTRQNKRSSPVYNKGKTSKPDPTRSPRLKRDVGYSATGNDTDQAEKAILGKNGMPINVTKVNTYYKYSIVSQGSNYNATLNDSNSLNKESNTNTAEKYFNSTNNDKDRDVIVTESPSMKSIEENMIIIDKDYYTHEKPKMTMVKLVKNDSMVKHSYFVPQSTQMASNITNETNIVRDFKSKSRLIRKIITPQHKKYNRSKIVKTRNALKEYIHQSNSETSFKDRVYHKIDDIQNILRNMLNDFHKNTTAKLKVKRKRFNLLRYLKRFFRKIFRKYNLNNMNERTKITKHIIHTICESFDQCDKSQIKNVKLEPKVKKLNVEALNILRSIKIIKGLLHLLDVPKTYKTENEEYKFKNEIHKLNAVLKDHYVIHNKNVSLEQLTQIRYIKNNTQYFVRSVANFARILNDIIEILTRKDEKSNLRKQQIQIRNNIENFNKGIKSYTLQEDLKKLKSLLFKYNLVQNKFVRRMYDVLTNFERGQEGMKVSGERQKEINTTIAIERFSRNIITNLRKLNSLAQTLNFSKRRKRHTTRDDDAVEYLLTLMEYMLKQNYALDTAPPNDGIDLLLDAIRSAPDIKPIKKKVLQSVPAILRAVDSKDSPSNETSEGEHLSSEPESRSIEGNNTVDTHLRDTLDSDRDADDEDVTIRSIFEDNTDNIYNERVDSTTMVSNFALTTDILVSTTPLVSEEDNRQPTRKPEEGGGGDSGNSKFEVFTGDLEESDEIDTNILTASTTTPAYGDIESDNNPIPTLVYQQPTSKFKLSAVKRYNSDISKSEETNKRFPFDWLDDSFDQEVRDIKINKSVPVTVTIQPLTSLPLETKSPSLKKDVDTISSITKEIGDDENQSQSEKVKTEEIIFKKQMDLLNSLDYGTEKKDADESESKGELEDAFPSYFV